jgi:hypothetical protein
MRHTRGVTSVTGSRRRTGDIEARRSRRRPMIAVMASLRRLRCLSSVKGDDYAETARSALRDVSES